MVQVKIRTGLNRNPENSWETFEIPTVKDTGELLDALVEIGLDRYQKKASGSSIFRYLTERALREQAATGKVTFQAIHHEGKMDLTEAKRTAWESFADGLICLFINGQQIHGLEDILELVDGTELVFLKLTMLTGNYFD